ERVLLGLALARARVGLRLSTGGFRRIGEAGKDRQCHAHTEYFAQRRACPTINRPDWAQPNWIRQRNSPNPPTPRSVWCQPQARLQHAGNHTGEALRPSKTDASSPPKVAAPARNARS